MENVPEDDEISKLDAEIKEGESLTQEAASADQQLSSLVWICTSTHSISKVTVIDANNPADVLESFHVCSSHLLCIASVPGKECKQYFVFAFHSPSWYLHVHVFVITGAKEDDYAVDEELNKVIVEESSRDSKSPSSSTKKEDEVSDTSVKTAIGSISFVSCATGVDAMQSLAGETESEEGGQSLTLFIN